MTEKSPTAEVQESPITAQGGRLVSGMGFAFSVPTNWSTTYTSTSTREKIVFAKVQNTQDLIEANEFNATEFDEFYGGLGKWTLSFDEEQDCWVTTTISTQNESSSSCTDPYASIDGKPVFLTLHKSVVIPVSPQRFIFFTSNMGSATIFEDFVTKADLDFF